MLYAFLHAALSRVLKREDLAALQVVGQFNLGFIIAKLRGDLFILDQHACDEKRNYERLQRETIIHQQPLVRALPFETTGERCYGVCIIAWCEVMLSDSSYMCNVFLLTVETQSVFHVLATACHVSRCTIL